LTTILSTKIVDLDVYEFYLMIRVLLRCSFTLKLPEKSNMSSRSVFLSSGLIYCLWTFYGLVESVNAFIWVFEVFLVQK
jgi:hypothetical protein